MASWEIQQLDDDLWRIAERCNVYLLREGDRAIAIDFGSGDWLEALERLGIRTLEHVLLTHHHAEQCAGLLRHAPGTFQVHAATGERDYLDPEAVAQWYATPWIGTGCPSSYAVPPRGIPGINYDLYGFGDFWWGGRRIRCLHTPGHGPHALTLLLDHCGKQFAFCGDAAHAGGTIWQPFHLEWDHWTGGGVLAAWEGVQRLLGVHIDCLCPAHGPVVSEQPRALLHTLAERLLRLYHAKGQISPDEPDAYLQPEPLGDGVFRYLLHLYQFGGNGYLLLSESGEGLVIDPYLNDFPALERLLARLPQLRLTATTATHTHFDHCDGIPTLRERYGTQSWLHPRVAAPLAAPERTVLPWQPRTPIIPDHLWPENGAWRWQEYDFTVAHGPGQTWGHTLFMTTIDGQRVCFTGDSFQPASRWNGTGGFCAYNQSRFAEGFIPTALRIQQWAPQVIAAGHGCCYRYAAEKFTKIRRWAEETAQVLAALCPSGDLEMDYYCAAEVYAAHLRDAQALDACGVERGN